VPCNGLQWRWLNEPLNFTEAPVNFKKPPFLYKYCSLERAVQILKDQYVYLCAPEDLNDLFEGSVGRIPEYTPEIGFELEWRRIRAYTGWTNEESKSFVREQNDEAEMLSGFNYSVDQLKILNSLVRKHSGITCFSEHRMDQRMWGTYGDNHRGVCIEFVNHGPSSLIGKHALPVVYEGKQDTEVVSDVMSDDGTLNIGLFGFHFYLKKSIAWESEREWRILMLSAKNQSAEDRKLRFERTDVKRIFLGPRVTESDAALIHEFAKREAHKWSVFQLRADSDSGTTSLEGVEALGSSEDLRYWVGQSQRAPK
jgi:Protein of unknown function (DUF2971)